MRIILLVAASLAFLQVFTQDTIVAKYGDTSDTKTLDEIVVSASLMRERLLQFPVSIEKESEGHFTRSAAPSFFDALQSTKGIQMITPSLGFRVINTGALPTPPTYDLLNW